MSNNHRLQHVIFCRRFNDERVINYEWPKESFKLDSEDEDFDNALKTILNFVVSLSLLHVL